MGCRRVDLWFGSSAWPGKLLYGLRSRGTRRVTKVYSASCLKMGRNSASWKNNSASRLKIALDSASLFLDSTSWIAEPQPFLVKTWIGELSGDSVSWTGWDSEIVEIDELTG